LNLKKLKNAPPWDWPADASDIVISALSNRKASKADRLLAADLAGEYVILSEDIFDALITVVCSHEESAELRSTAAIALGPGLEDSFDGDYEDTEDPPALSKSFVQKIQKMLRNIYMDAEAPKSVRRSVLEASIRDPLEWHASAVKSAYACDDEEWKLTAVFCMNYLKGFEGQILESLTSSNPHIRYHAVNAAGNWEIDAAWPYIVQLVTSDNVDKSLRIAAIKAAASIRPHESDILEPLVDSDDEDISETAMEALAEAAYASGMDSDDYEEDEEEEYEDDEEEDEEYEDEDEDEDDDNDDEDER
jgi:hypothetical protein